MKNLAKVSLTALFSLLLLAGCTGSSDNSSTASSSSSTAASAKVDGAKTYDGATFKTEYPMEYTVMDEENFSTFYDENSATLSSFTDKESFEAQYKDILDSGVTFMGINLTDANAAFTDNFNVLSTPTEGLDAKDIIQQVYDSELQSLLTSLEAKTTKELTFEEINGRETGYYQFSYSVDGTDVLGTQFLLESNEQLLIITLTATTNDGLEDFKNTVVATIEYK